MNSLHHIVDDDVELFRLCQLVQSYGQSEFCFRSEFHCLVGVLRTCSRCHCEALCKSGCSVAATVPDPAVDVCFKKYVFDKWLCCFFKMLTFRSFCKTVGHFLGYTSGVKCFSIPIIFQISVDNVVFNLFSSLRSSNAHAPFVLLLGVFAASNCFPSGRSNFGNNLTQFITFSAICCATSSLAPGRILPQGQHVCPGRELL